MMRKLWSFAFLLGVLLPVGVLNAAPTPCCRCTADNDPKATLCVKTTTTNCPSLKESKNSDVRQLTCTTSLTEGQCQPLAKAGGVCANTPTDELLFKIVKPAATTPEEANIYAPPELGVPIPGLVFSTDIKKDSVLRIPWFAQYISAIHTYLVGISIVAAAILIVYGGLLYIVGSSMENVSKGKTIITDAVIGLFLVLGAYTILLTINPELVSPQSQELRIVHRQDAFTDPAQEMLRVVASATVKSTAAPGEVPVVEIIQGPGETSSEVISPGSSAKGLVGPPGTVARDETGNLVAQGSCPESMVPIKNSEDYKARTGKNIQSFCMDRYEAPNQKGKKPILGAFEWEAEFYCNERGKRLCTTNEWIRACTGPKAEDTYGYNPNGNTFIPGPFVSKGVKDSREFKQTGNPPAPCNYDTPTNAIARFGRLTDFAVKCPVKKPEQSILNPASTVLANPKCKSLFDTMMSHIATLDKSEPSGTRARCVTAEGVRDMSGNVTEMTVRDRDAGLTTEQRIAKGNAVGGAKPYNWMGFYWDPVAHEATSLREPTCDFGAPAGPGGGVGGPHPVGWRDYANGFRCCLSMQE